MPRSQAPDLSVAANAGRPVGQLVSGRGRHLAVDDTVAAARRVFANRSVQVLPVLDERRYAGAVTRESLDGVDADEPLGAVARALLPTAPADEPLETALPALAARAATRLVVLDPGNGGYVGLVCLRGDREQLCLDAECHA